MIMVFVEPITHCHHTWKTTHAQVYPQKSNQWNKLEMMVMPSIGRDRQKMEDKIQLRKFMELLWLDSRWIVPYCPILLWVFKAHINTKLCHSVKSINYDFKYVNKGSDMVVFATENREASDDITQYELVYK